MASSTVKAMRQGNQSVSAGAATGLLSSELHQVVAKLASEMSDQPRLFPNGVTHIHIELKISESTTFILDIEGPQAVPKS